MHRSWPVFRAEFIIKIFRRLILPGIAFLCLAACLSPRPAYLGAARRDQAALRAEAGGIVAGLEKRFLRAFPGTSYPDYGALEARLLSGRESLGAEFTDMVLGQKVRVGMHARENARPLIASKGFLNIHASAASSFDISAQDRNAVEASCLGVGLEAYSRLSPQVKPKYAFLLPPENSPLAPAGLGKWYGPDLYIFKMGNIKKRLTWTPGDSLDRVDKWASALGIDWKSGEAFYPADWDLFFIPWRYRALIVPLIAEDVRRSGSLAFSSTPERPFYNLPEGEKLKTAFYGPNAVYLETQIWGPLDLGDVEMFIFTLTPPQGDFLKLLKEYGIPVYDGRKGKPVRWLSTLTGPLFSGRIAFSNFKTGETGDLFFAKRRDNGIFNFNV